MSTVSSMVVTCSLIEGDTVKLLNEWMIRNARYGTFQPIQLNMAGGGKAMQIEAFACAVNNFDEEALIALFPLLPWSFPEEAVLIVYPEYGPPTITRGVS
jgi:hypothetical protein